MTRPTLEALEKAGSTLFAAVAACPEQYRDELHELAWRVGNLAAKIDPWEGDEDTVTESPFGNATERGN